MTAASPLRSVRDGGAGRRTAPPEEKETNEPGAAELGLRSTALRRLADDETTPEQRLAARMAALLPTGPTTATVLRDALAAWNRRHALTEDFLTLHSAHSA